MNALVQALKALLCHHCHIKLYRIKHHIGLLFMQCGVIDICDKARYLEFFSADFYCVANLHPHVVCMHSVHSDFVLILWKRALDETCEVDIPGLCVYTDGSVLFAVCVVVLSLIAIEILVERDRSFAAIAVFFVWSCFYLA